MTAHRCRRKPELVVAVDVAGAGDYVVTITHEGGVVVVAHHQEEKDAIAHGAELERALAWSPVPCPRIFPPYDLTSLRDVFATNPNFRASASAFVRDIGSNRCVRLALFLVYNTFPDDTIVYLGEGDRTDLELVAALLPLLLGYRLAPQLEIRR